MTAASASDSTGPTTRPKPEPSLTGTGTSRIGGVSNLIWLLRRVVSADPRSAGLWLGMSLLIGLATPIELWAAKGAVDNLQERLEGGAGSSVWWFAALWVAVIVVIAMYGRFEWMFAASAQERGGAAIAADTLEKATRIDLASFEHQEFYDKVAVVLTDAEQKANDAVYQFAQFGWTIPRTITYMAVLIAFDWRLFLIALLPQMPAIWAWFFSGKLYWEVYREQTRERRLATYYAGLLTDRQAAKEVRLFGLAPELIGRWERSYWATARDLRNRGLRLGFKQRGLTLVSITILMLGLAWYISSFAPDDTSAGMAVVVISSVVSLFGGILNLAEPIQKLGQASGFATDLRGFLELPEESDGRTGRPTLTPGASELRLEGVSFTYPGARQPTLSDITLTIRAGETIALVGENGAGKTTLVKLMLGLYKPDMGRVLLDGQDLATLDPAQARKLFSGIFQQFVRYPFSARENVTLGEDVSDHDVAHALALAGLTQITERLPEGLDTNLSPELGGSDLSGGQWQRVAIARAGIRDAHVIALDEPTAALDPLAEVAIFRRFAQIAAGRTAILVSHRLGMARLADRIVVLDGGKLIEEGTHDDLLGQEHAEYAAMWHAQARWYR